MVKVGDRVAVKVADVCAVSGSVKITNSAWLWPGEFEPVSVADSNGNQTGITIREGRFYKTRDGRKVGPMHKRYYSTVEHQWEDGDTGDLYRDDGTSDYNEDIIAELTDAPAVANADIFDELEDWMADNPLPDATPTTGFTVPLEAPEFANDNDEPDAKLLVTISADTSALDAEIDRVLKRLRKLKRKAKKMGISLEYSELRDAA